MKILKIALIVIAFLVISAVVFYQVFFRLPLPDYDGTIELSGLTSDVEVRFDEYGVPHIFAENEADLFFAQGYITARERMFQMDMTRRAGRGELSVIFGDVTKDADRFLKTVGFYRTAKKEYEVLPQEYKDIIIAYTNGVNTYIENVKHLPREYVILGVRPEPWVPEDTVVCGNLMAYNLTRSKKTDLILYQIGEAAGEEILEVITPSFPEFAPNVSMVDETIPSNRGSESSFTAFESSDLEFTYDTSDLFPPEITASNWMIFSGSMTTTGEPIFTGSPDLEPKIPALFYLVHLKGGDFDVIGGSIPGTPGVNVLGFNGMIAWSTVNGRVDELDYFVEKINPDNPDQYLTEEGYRDFEIIEETIKIKTKDGITEEPFTVRISRHGPIISDVMSLAPENTAMMWVGLEPGGIFMGFTELMKASNFEEFRRALSFVKTPTLNIGYADIDGNIGYQYMASPPIRKDGNDGTLPVPGWTGEHDWVGYVPFEELPYDLNPEKGYLASFNNEAKRTNYHMTNYYMFERALSFEEKAKDLSKLTLEEAREMQLDTFSAIAKRWVPLVLKASVDNEGLAEALKLFEGWDFSIDKESSGATLFNSFYFHMMGNTLEDETGEDIWKEHLSWYYIIYVPDIVLTRIIDDNENPLFDDVNTPDVKETRDDIILMSMVDAVDELTERLGKDPEDWEWGKVHRMTFTHPLGGKLPFFNLSPIPTSGDGFTINAGLWDNNNPYEMVSGGVIRMVVDFSDIEKSTFISPPGQSGLYMSPHYDDMAQMWADGGQIPMNYLTGKELEDVLILKKK